MFPLPPHPTFRLVPSLGGWQAAGGQAAFAAYLSTCAHTPPPATPSAPKGLLHTHTNPILHRSYPSSQCCSFAFSLAQGTHVKHRQSPAKRISQTHSDEVVTVQHATFKEKS